MIQPIGYLKLWREIASKPIWLNSTPEQKTILITLLMMANWKGKQWEWQGKKFEAEPGQFVTSAKSIIENCGLGITRQNVRTALKRFEKLDFLTYTSTNTGVLITIANWGVYQCDEDKPNQVPNQSLTKTQPSPNQDLTTIEEGKKDKKEIKKELKDTCTIDNSFKAIRKLYPGTKTLAVAEKKLLPLIKDHGEEEMIRVVERYKESVLHQRNDGHKDLSYLNESTFWNGRYKDFLDEYYQEPVKTKKAPVKNDNNRFQNFKGTLASKSNEDLVVMMKRKSEERKKV